MMTFALSRNFLGSHGTDWWDGARSGGVAVSDVPALISKAIRKATYPFSALPMDLIGRLIDGSAPFSDSQGFVSLRGGGI